ncbi:MAG: RnfH family protein [Thiotrichales bacterium]|nr:RnfH family protein [Thiotrichales bacterium]
MRIEVAYALEKEQFLFSQEVAEGCRVDQALADSALLKRFPNLDCSYLGIFGKRVEPDQILQEGDRIEVYRPLKADPRERRREKVSQEREAEQ